MSEVVARLASTFDLRPFDLYTCFFMSSVIVLSRAA